MRGERRVESLSVSTRSMIYGQRVKRKGMSVSFLGDEDEEKECSHVRSIRRIIGREMQRLFPSGKQGKC